MASRMWRLSWAMPDAVWREDDARWKEAAVKSCARVAARLTTLKPLDVMVFAVVVMLAEGDDEEEDSGLGKLALDVAAAVTLFEVLVSCSAFSRRFSMAPLVTERDVKVPMRAESSSDDTIYVPRRSVTVDPRESVETTRARRSGISGDGLSLNDSSRAIVIFRWRTGLFVSSGELLFGEASADSGGGVVDGETDAALASFAAAPSEGDDDGDEANGLILLNTKLMAVQK